VDLFNWEGFREGLRLQYSSIKDEFSRSCMMAWLLSYSLARERGVLFLLSVIYLLAPHYNSLRTTLQLLEITPKWRGVKPSLSN
jgi:hypothetical protein